MSTILTAQNLHKKFGSNEVLKGVDLAVDKGQVIAIIGPSGSGKSTLLRCLNNLEKIDDGSICIDDEPLVENGVYRPAKELAAASAKLVMVFQNFNLFPHLTVEENLTLAPTIVKGLSKEEAASKAAALLEKVGLSAKADAYPGDLSGGQQQRVAIARALAMDPEILLFDEPTSALDPELIGEVLRVIKSLAEENSTMIIVTHEMQFAAEVAGQIIFMDEGQIIAAGPPEEVIGNPQNERVKTFLTRLH